MKNRISLFIATFLIIGFFFLALPIESHSGLGTMPGCCINTNSNSCVGCESGCSTTPEFCADNGGTDFLDGEFCVTGGPGALCSVFPPSVTGCCIRTSGVCDDDATFNDCFDNGGDAWDVNQVCSELPECSIQVSDVPSINQWGLIAMAGILGILGFIFVIRRSKVTT